MQSSGEPPAFPEPRPAPLLSLAVTREAKHPRGPRPVLTRRQGPSLCRAAARDRPLVCCLFCEGWDLWGQESRFYFLDYKFVILDISFL